MAHFLGKDLNLVPFFQAHDAAQIDLVAKELPGGGIFAVNEFVNDLTYLEDRQNLAQALILRLLTPVGSLAALGHAAYGSRLHELIGREKNDTLRHLCRVFVLEVVAQEPRVDDKAVSFAFEPEAETLSSLVFTLKVQPHSDDEPLGLSVEVNI
jgi:phage baseplate assembly protein W